MSSASCDKAITFFVLYVVDSWQRIHHTNQKPQVLYSVNNILGILIGMSVLEFLLGLFIICYGFVLLPLGDSEVSIFITSVTVLYSYVIYFIIL
ncbi:hypothetical protein AALO_G00178490 [Alosa alosa]|uniref:Uncharacterized protein n=1 Tax=Alosa alosa TaxID=278164 RepID=A0AAV6GD73_9TELE|nr:hypothetical protein AALO_G00178490 [Alosa alosa]